jgi:hypothetical protein
MQSSLPRVLDTRRKCGLALRMICSWPYGRKEPGKRRPMRARYHASESRGAWMSIRSSGIMSRPNTIVWRKNRPLSASTLAIRANSPPIDLVLPPGAVILARAEVLEGAEARHGVEPSEAVACDLPRDLEVDLEAVPPAGRRLRGGQSDADPGPSSAPDEVEQRAPPAAQVENAPPRSDPICSAT